MSRALYETVASPKTLMAVLIVNGNIADCCTYADNKALAQLKEWARDHRDNRGHQVRLVRRWVPRSLSPEAWLVYTWNARKEGEAK